jgi:hypothetical protein
MKTYGANIWCAFPDCHAEPYPDDPRTTRETFSLLRLGPNGRPAESPAPGEWRCEEHRIPEQDLPAKRAPRAAPGEALSDFENVLGAEMACLGEEVADGDRSDAKAALEVFQREVGRSLASLRKAVQP